MSDPVRSYLAVAIIGVACAGGALAVLVLGGLLRPRRTGSTGAAGGPARSAPGIVERGRLPPSFTWVFNRARASALRIWVVGPEDHALPDAASTAGAAVVAEMLDGAGAVGARRAGVRRASAASAANVLLVATDHAGSDSVADVVAAYHSMPHPKYVVAISSTAASAVASNVPVDITVASDTGPVDARAVLDAFADLQRLILAEDPAARWTAGPQRPPDSPVSLGPPR